MTQTALVVGASGIVGSAISQLLIDNGKSPDTPAAVVMYASQQRQQVVTGTLTTLPDEAARLKLHPPALIVVGDVVNLHQVLAFAATQIDITQEPPLEAVS